MKKLNKNWFFDFQSKKSKKIIGLGSIFEKPVRIVKNDFTTF